jgi:hypothetical protein
VLDGDDIDWVVPIVDARDDPVVAASGAVQALEVKLERLAYTSGIGRQGAVQELDDRADLRQVNECCDGPLPRSAVVDRRLASNKRGPRKEPISPSKSGLIRHAHQRGRPRQTRS